MSVRPKVFWEIGIIIILQFVVLYLRPEKDALLQLYLGNNVLLELRWRWSLKLSMLP